MGLLDIWNDWKKENQSQSDGFQDYLPDEKGTVGTLDTAGGVKGEGIKATMNRTGESPLIKKPIFNTQMFPPGQGQVKIGGKTINLPQSVLTDKAKVAQNNAIKQAQVNASNKTVVWKNIEVISQIEKTQNGAQLYLPTLKEVTPNELTPSRYQNGTKLSVRGTEAAINPLLKYLKVKASEDDVVVVMVLMVVVVGMY